MKSKKYHCDNHNKRCDKICNSKKKKKIHCPLLTLPSNASLNMISKALNNHISFSGSGYFSRSNSTSILCNDSSGIFPYYRSCEIQPDTVLVKDVGVSCNLMKLTKKKSNEKCFPKGKKNYQYDLSTITKKISTYTKGFISNFNINIPEKSFQRQAEKKNGIIKIPIAEEYFDTEGRLCLKLRLIDSQESHKTLSTKNSLYEKQTPKACNSFEEMKVLFKHEKNQSVADDLSTQTSSLYNYLTTGRKKSGNEEKNKNQKVESNKAVVSRKNHGHDEAQDMMIERNFRRLCLLESTQRQSQLSAKKNDCKEKLANIQNNLKQMNGIISDIPQIKEKLIERKSRTKPTAHNLTIFKDERLTNVNLHTINIRITKHKRGE